MAKRQRQDTVTVDRLTEQNVHRMAQLERIARGGNTTSERIANAVASFCGTMAFVWLHIVWFSGWIGLNLWPGIAHIDPFPFTFLTLVVSLEAIFLSTFILISQNQEARLEERRGQLDLQINLLTEQENTKMLNMLERIAQKVGVEVNDDPELALLKQATRPDKLMEQLERASGKTVGGA